MDDMRNTSAPLYGKAEPATTKTTMSVREMRQLLGLGKTDSYWLLHKNLFEVILMNFANGPIPFLTPPRY